MVGNAQAVPPRNVWPLAASSNADVVFEFTRGKKWLCWIAVCALSSLSEKSRLYGY
jgi:hypothetical protein